jgi:hypothetical protein
MYQARKLDTYADLSSLTGLVLGLDAVAANPVRFVPSGLWWMVGDSTSLLCRHCDFVPLIDA